MGLGHFRSLWLGTLAILVCMPAEAAPKLRLTNTVVGPVSIAAGANGPAQVVEAYNEGDGSLNLSVSASAAWITASAGAARACSSRPGSCLPLNIGLQTASLARGQHSGMVTVRDPNAQDAPQTIAVIASVGGSVPDRVELLVAPNGSSDDAVFTTNNLISGAATTQTGGNWLSVSLDGGGSFRFVLPYRIRAVHQPGMGEGTYNGSVAVSGSSLPADNKTVPVALRVTSQPIARVSETSLEFRIAQNTPRHVRNLAVTNRGLGTLNITGVQSTAAGGNWLSAERVAGFDVVSVRADAAGLSPGFHEGSVTVVTNAVNNTVVVPVRLEVVAQSAPLAAFQGVVNNATFEAGDVLARGTIAAVFGEQFSYGEPAGAPGLPLPTEIGGTRVFVNDRPAPLYFTSYGQVNFQVPYDTPAGDARVRVERQGQRGNTVSVRIANMAPRILRLGIGDYGIIVNPDGTFPIPSTAGIPSRPARRGEALVIYAIGFGQTTPPVESGVAAPIDPLGWVLPLPKVLFGASSISSGVAVDPLFVGLTPGFVGLYQINVIVPEETRRGNQVVMLVESNGTSSNRVQIAIE